jgi:hypothetical protein
LSKKIDEEIDFFSFERERDIKAFIKTLGFRLEYLPLFIETWKLVAHFKSSVGLALI